MIVPLRRAISLLLAVCAGLLPAASHAADSPASAPAETAAMADSAAPGTTYCNPMNLDYGFSPIPGAFDQARHRTTADPVIVPFRSEYYLFATNQWGYWWSRDLLAWTFVPRRFLLPHHKVFDELCAPAAWVMDDALHVIGSANTPDFPIWRSRNPQRDDWEQAVPEFGLPAWDPAFFLDDDGRLYLYYGSSFDKPVRGVEVDRRTLKPLGPPQDLIRLHDDLHGWERFGEHNDNTFLRPFMEGAWMNKHAGRYYLQYGAPGTEFSGYADGVYVGDAPLGPFTYQQHNPFAIKAGGYARGTGHGATFQDHAGHWWHTGTIAINVKNNFERRIGLWPAGFDADGVLWCDTAYGDFPQRITRPDARGAASRTQTGWMILNYARPVRASSTLGGYGPNFAVDEDIRTYWSAASADAGEWFESDLGEPRTVHAVQVNFADQDAAHTGKIPGLFHQYRLLHSLDGQTWELLVDKSTQQRDTPHDYVELPRPVEARFVRLENVHTASGKFALSGLRVFGRGHGPPPPAVENFVVLRGDSERRNAWLKWKANDAATGYVIYSGATPDKLYSSTMVLGDSEYYFRALHRDEPHYFQIEAFNENGISVRSPTVKAE